MKNERYGLMWNLTDADFFEGFGLTETRINGKTLFADGEGNYWRVDLSSGYIAVEYSDRSGAACGSFDTAEYYNISRNESRDDIVRKVRKDMPYTLTHPELFRFRHSR